MTCLGRLALFLAVLTGCAPAPDPVAVLPLRNPTAPVASQTDATALRLEGRWRVVAASDLPVGLELRIADETLSAGTARYALTQTGPGRFALNGAPLWVHWLDADNRTVALGDPGGGRVWILDRGRAAPDRLRAAREILTWYGYDLSRVPT